MAWSSLCRTLFLRSFWRGSAVHGKPLALLYPTHYAWCQGCNSTQDIVEFAFGSEIAGRPPDDFPPSPFRRPRTDLYRIVRPCATKGWLRETRSAATSMLFVLTTTRFHQEI